MNNNGIYYIALVVSVILLIPSLFWDSAITNLLSGIGCSGVAAALMSIFIEINLKRQEKERIQKAKYLYFQQINGHLIMIIERILWLEKQLDNPNFNWDLTEQEYLSFQFVIVEGTRDNKTISYDEAIEELRKIGEKYNLDNLPKLSEEKRNRVIKMFRIVAESTRDLLVETNNLEINKVYLDRENYLSLDTNKQLQRNIVLLSGLMIRPDKNYKVAIIGLIQASKIIREIGGYSNDISISLHKYVSINEI